MKRKRRNPKVGLPPGVPVYTGENASATTLNMVVFDDNNFVLRRNISVDETFKLQGTNTTNWIMVNGFRDDVQLHNLGEHFGIHPLILEDIFNMEQMPKVDDTDKNLFVTLKNLVWNPTKESIDSEQISLFLSNNILITFEENPHTYFQPIIERLQANTGRARMRQEDFLCYLLIDSIVDNYYLLLDNLEESIEDLEREMLDNPNKVLTPRYLQMKKNLLLLRKSVFPLKEEIRYLYRGDSAIISDNTREYLGDVSDHLTFITQSIDNYRDLIASMMDLMMANNANRMNSIMKTLTIVSTIFIPITFLSSMYGMNFHYMPELSWKYGYAFFLVSCTVITIGMVLYMKHKKWF